MSEKGFSVNRFVLSALLAVVGVGSFALAQQPLKVPNYDLSTSPALLVGESQGGELSRDDGRDFINGGYVDVWAIPSGGGEVLELQISTRGFVAFGTLFSPSGELLDYRSDTSFMGDTSVTTLAARLSESGLYMLVVSGFGPDSLGDYQLSRASTAVGEGTTRLVSLPAVFDASVGPLTSDVVVFELVAASTIRAELRTSGWPALLTLTGPSPGSFVSNASNAYGGDALIINVLEAGRYELRIEPAGGVGGGPYSLSLESVEEVDAAAAGGDVSSPGRLDAQRLEPFGSVRYRLLLDQDARVTLDLSSLEFDTFLEVRHEATDEFIGADDDTYGTDSYLELDLRAGAYLVLVSGWGGSGGVFSLAIDWE